MITPFTRGNTWRDHWGGELQRGIGQALTAEEERRVAVDVQRGEPIHPRQRSKGEGAARSGPSLAFLDSGCERPSQRACYDAVYYY